VTHKDNCGYKAQSRYFEHRNKGSLLHGHRTGAAVGSVEKFEEERPTHLLLQVCVPDLRSRYAVDFNRYERCDEHVAISIHVRCKLLKSFCLSENTTKAICSCPGKPVRYPAQAQEHGTTSLLGRTLMSEFFITPVGSRVEDCTQTGDPVQTCEDGSREKIIKSPRHSVGVGGSPGIVRSCEPQTETH
jgi:hypothetical protein